MGETVKIWPFNILETGEVTVTGTPDTGYPVARLYDRSGNFFWKVTAGPTDYTFEVHQLGDAFGMTADAFGMSTDDFGMGANRDIDLLYIPRHNFRNFECFWEYSVDGFNWTEQTTWIQGDDDPIVKTISSAVTAPWWRVRVLAIPNPTCSEIWMGGGYSFGVKARPSPMHQYNPNVSWIMSIGGQERGTKLGDAGRLRTYNLKIDATALANYNIIVTDLDNFSKPFIVKDKDDEYFMGRFEAAPSNDYITPDLTELNFNIREML